MEDFYATYGRNLNLDKYVRLAARACGRPSAILHLLGDENQYTLAQYGTLLDIGYRMKRCDSICDFTGHLRRGEVLSIRDTFADERVKDLPAVSGPPHFRWYLGTPIYSPENELIGALCVLDQGENTIEASDDMKASLIDLADCVETELALRADCNMALRAKKDFLTSVSHELRDPMHGISMGLELLSTSHTNEAEEQLALDTVRKCSLSLEGLVDKILYINDKETNRPSTSTMEIVNVAEVVENVLDSAWLESTQAAGTAMKYLEVALRVHPNLVNLEYLFDRRVLAKTIQQLFNNATKFTKLGLITVTLESKPCTGVNCSLLDAEHETLHLSVQDTGCGMSPEFLDQAFDQFSQEDPLKEGVGLGLSVVKKLLQEVQGTFLMSSEVDKGTLVEVSFCIARADSSQEEMTASQKLLRGKGFALTPAVSKEVAATIEEYCMNFGMCKSSLDKADCLIGICNEDHVSMVHPNILIAHDSLHKRRNSVHDTSVIISLPVGAFKLRQALSKVLGMDASRTLLNTVGTGLISRGSPRFTKTGELDLRYEAGLLKPISPTMTQGPMSNHSSPRLNHYNRTCLIVDDNPINVRILCAFLKKRGFLFSCASDGIEAVQAVKARSAATPFDYILMDINMPNMNGVEATRLIREYQSEHGIRESLVVAISGCSDAEQTTAMNLGLKHFFKKPVDLKRLTQFMDDNLHL